MTEKKDFNEETRQQWEQKAEFWDNLHGDDGNRYHRELISPVVERLLAIRPGEQILDISCGSGILARRMAALGADVTAVDFSAVMIERARARKQVRGNPVVYKVVDATNEEALATLGGGSFAAVTSTMALMDMAEIGPLYRAVVRLLKPGGRFVFATSHPAFSSNNPIFLAEEEIVDGKIVRQNYMKIAGYLDVPPTLSAGARNEPNPHFYFHRPLSELFAAGFEAGLVLDALEEPAFTPPEGEPLQPLSWYGYPQIPPVLAGRMRVMKSD
jgi:2-polyprenyl-3-methyl-5-hydroxy-6-metoxy-1,4-benzoquinol methylase